MFVNNFFSFVNVNSSKVFINFENFFLSLIVVVEVVVNVIVQVVVVRVVVFFVFVCNYIKNLVVHLFFNSNSFNNFYSDLILIFFDFENICFEVFDSFFLRVVWFVFLIFDLNFFDLVDIVILLLKFLSRMDRKKYRFIFKRY